METNLGLYSIVLSYLACAGTLVYCIVTDAQQRGGRHV